MLQLGVISPVPPLPGEPVKVSRTDSLGIRGKPNRGGMPQQRATARQQQLVLASSFYYYYFINPESDGPSFIGLSSELQPFPTFTAV